MRLNKLSILSLGVAASCLFVPGLASAQNAPIGPIWVTLGDGAEPDVPFTYGPNPPSNGNVSSIYSGGTTFTNGTLVTPGGASATDTSVTFSDETTPGALLGAIDMHIEYQSIGAVPITGAVVVFNISGLEESGVSGLSDTLSLAFSNHTPVSINDNANISVDLHFRSDASQTPPALPGTNVFNITEPTFPSFQDLSALIQSVPGTPGDFNVQHNSWSVPEPGSLALLVGMTFGGGLLACRRTKR